MSIKLYSDKLEVLATWFDYYDEMGLNTSGITKNNEVQEDLRKIAHILRAIETVYKSTT